VQGALAALNGVEEVEVDYGLKLVKVSGTAEVSEMLGALESAGFGGSVED
jgi:copper chaperone CopZ